MAHKLCVFFGVDAVQDTKLNSRYNKKIIFFIKTITINRITRISVYTFKYVSILEEITMTEEKRSYRKSLTSHGLIYLAGEELKISVRNLSITGLLAELDPNSVITNIDEVFQAIDSSRIVDLYLPEMRVAGEADVVRAEKIEGQIYLALEFKDLTYDANSLLYKRKAYRKGIKASGRILLHEKTYDFSTENVSVDGLMIQLKENIDFEEGAITVFDFPRFDLRGKVKVVWIEHNEEGSTFMGLQYIEMAQEKIKGLPRFSSDS